MLHLNVKAQAGKENKNDGKGGRGKRNEAVEAAVGGAGLRVRVCIRAGGARRGRREREREIARRGGEERATGHEQMLIGSRRTRVYVFTFTFTYTYSALMNLLRLDLAFPNSRRPKNDRSFIRHFFFVSFCKDRRYPLVLFATRKQN